MAVALGIILLKLVVLILVAKLAGELAERIRQPAVLGDLLAGVLLGPSLLGLVDLGAHDEGVALITFLASFGAIILLMEVGLETRLKDMLGVGVSAGLVAIVGIVAAFAAGFGISWLLGELGVWPTSWLFHVFIGATMTATSVGITARVLADMGVLGRTEARIILGAAVIDDVLGLMVLTVVQALGQEGTLDPLRIVILLAQALIFVGLLMYFGGRLVRRVLGQNPLAERWEWASPKGPMFAIAVIVCLGLSAGAALIGLAAIIGAFLAGMAFAATESRHDLVERFEGIVQFLTPFFFGYIGLQVDLAVAASVWPLVVGVTIVALLTKVVGCGVGALALGKRSAFAVGVGMMPRGEVGIIVALIGLSMAAIPEGLYAVVVGMSLLTTLVTPPILVWAFKRLPGAAPAAPLAPAH